MDTMYLKPAAGCLLRDPQTGEPVPQEGGFVPLGLNRFYWLRRIKDGDAVQCPAPAAGKRRAPAQLEKE